jgi:hypothetical protein
VASTAQARGLSLPSLYVKVPDVLRVIDALTGAATASGDSGTNSFNSDSSLDNKLFLQYCSLLGDVSAGKAMPHRLADFAEAYLKN